MADGFLISISFCTFEIVELSWNQWCKRKLKLDLTT